MSTFNTWDVIFIMKGFLLTIILCLSVMVLSIPIALLFGILRFILNRSKNTLLIFIKFILSGFLTIIRGTPLMLQLIFIYFGLPFMGINISATLAAFFGLGIYSVAYLIEIVRSGFESVSQSQWDATAALGFNYLQTMRLVIVPQAIRIMLPPVASFFIALIKDSSLVAIIGFVELTRASRIVVEKTYQSILIFSIAALLYFIICYPLSIMTQKMEKALEKSKEVF